MRKTVAAVRYSPVDLEPGFVGRAPSTAKHGITALGLKTEAGAAGSLVALAERIELWPIDRLRPYERNLTGGSVTYSNNLEKIETATTA
jgi:hypothetical protein